MDEAIAAHAAWRDAAAEGREAGPELEAFGEAFLAVPASRWEQSTRADVELAGLDLTTRWPKALEDPERTVALLDRILARHADSESAREARESNLPYMLERCGAPCESIRRLEALSVEGSGPGRLIALLALADELAVAGRLAEAREAYGRASELAPSPAEVERFPVEFYQRLARCKLAHVGQELPSGGIAGDAERLLAGAHDRVLVLDFWATWCRPCLKALPTLEALHRRRDERLAVLGVTRPYERGFLPEGSDDLMKGEAVEGIAAEDYAAHLSEFRSRAELTFPVVVSDEATFERFGAASMPRTYVVAPDGTVSFCACSNGDEGQVARAVDRLLAH